eukprot:GEMP01029907.1.p1 GENE.GEMP01029907.1~~GEMP01029907.1.p1  ORF type:complete len:488 (+),score=107.32 GEMP01029907.1:130-1593(+)
MRAATNIAILLLANCVFSWNPAPPIYNVTTSNGTVVISIFPSGGPVRIAGPDFKPGADGKAVLVDYYSHGCPHCWFFAVTFTKVARAIHGGGVETVAVNCGDDKINPLCDKADVYIYPTLLFYAGREGAKCRDKPCHWGGPHDSARRVVSWTEEQFGRDPVTDPSALRNGAHFAEKRRYVRPMDPPGKDGWEGIQAFATTFDRWGDALLAFTNALKRHYEPWLYQKTLEVINFVVATIPGNRAALDELAEYIAKKSYESRAELAEMLDAWSGRWQLSTEFFACKNPTCGPWILFHVSVAANAVDLKDVASVGRGASPEESLAFVNTMVTHFFGCEQCVRHFNVMYASPARQAVHTGKDAVLWLWRAHERVNLRVTAEHNTHFDRRWPPYRQCPACWRASIVMGSEKPKPYRRLVSPLEQTRIAEREAAVLTTEGRSVEGYVERALDEDIEHVSWHDLDVPFNIDNVYMLLLQTYIGLENIQQTEIIL